MRNVADFFYGCDRRNAQHRDTDLQRDVVARIEHVLAEREGSWHVVIVGSQGSDRWETKITGPHAFERLYALAGASGEHEAGAVAAIVAGRS